MDLRGAGENGDRATQLISPLGLGTRELLADIEVIEAGRRHAGGMVERVAQAVEKFT